MRTGNDIERAITERDFVAIRKIARQTYSEMPRMFLNLVADFMERDSLKKMKKAA